MDASSGITTNQTEVEGAGDNVLAKHVAFFDRNHDGVIYPWETFQGFRAIGSGFLLSTVAAFFINMGLSGKTRPGKFPNLLFPIEIKNITKAKHGSDTDVYDTQGRFVESKFEDIFIDLSIQMNEQVRICLEWYQARVTNAHYNPAPMMIPPALAALDPTNRINEQKGERDEKDDFASLAQREQKSDDTFAALARSRMETPKHQHPQGERSPAAVVSSSSSTTTTTQDLLPSLDAITLQFDPVITKQTSPQQQISFDPFAPGSQQQSMSAPAPVPAAAPAPAAASPDSSFFDFINATSSPNPNPNVTSPLSSPDSLNDFIEISDQMNKTTISNNNNPPSGSGGPSLI